MLRGTNPRVRLRVKRPAGGAGSWRRPLWQPWAIGLWRVALGFYLVAHAAPASAVEEGPRYISADSPAGAQQLVADRWGMVGFRVVNPTDRPVELLATLYFQNDAGLQFGRRLWLPPQSRRRSSYLLRTPPEVPRGRQTIPVNALLFEQQGARQRLIAAPDGGVTHRGMLPLVVEPPLTAVLLGDTALEARAAVGAMREAVELSRRMTTLQTDSLPTSAFALEGLGNLVLGTDLLAQDAAACQAVRHWLHDGGRIWIMLDRVSPEAVQRLLGDTFRCHIVDRLSLTHFQVLDQRDVPRRADGPPQELEQPVDLVRVVGPDLQVTHTVAGWPAAFWHPAGKGRVLITTLGARGWVRPRTPDDPQPVSSRDRGALIATPPLTTLAARLVPVESPPPAASELWESSAVGPIGYRIVERRWVGLILLGFAASLLGAGLWLIPRGGLAHLGWVGPLLSLAAAGLLVLLGAGSRRAVPSTVSRIQVVEISPGTRDVAASGILAMYNQGELRQPLGSRDGGIFWPDMEGLEGTTRRMIWTDLDRWHWDHLALPTGIRLAPFRYHAVVAQPVVARARFGPDGLVGQLQAPAFASPTDALVATSAQRRMALNIRPDGSFTAGSPQVLAPNQYLTDVVLSDIQRQRQVMYRQLLGDAARPVRFSSPLLFAWTAPLEMQFDLVPEARQLGDSVLAVPLEFEPSDAGARVLVPTTFLPYESVPLPGLGGISSTYSNLEQKWLGPNHVESRTLLRFQVPPVLQPIRCQTARLTIKIRAPSRPLEVQGLVDGRLQTLERRESPVGLVQFQLDRPDALAVDERGGLRLGIFVGPPAKGGSDSIAVAGWQIDEVQLEITGETRPPAAGPSGS